VSIKELPGPLGEKSLVACKFVRTLSKRLRPRHLKLLIAIEVSDFADEVIGEVVARRWPTDSTALVITAIEYTAIPESVWRDVGGKVDPVRKKLLRQAADLTARAIDQLNESGLAAEAAIKVDDARFAIVKTADQWRADMIFIRASNLADPSRWFLNSVTDAVLRDANCSVTVVRRRDLSPRAMKVLLATDGSESARFATYSLAERPWPPQTEFKVISVVEPLVHFVKQAQSILEKKKNSVGEAQSSVHEASQIIALRGLKITVEVLSGDPKEKIIDTAREWAADLAVLGSHGHSPLKRSLLGSVSEAVARDGPCSVEVTRRSQVPLH
jgi:nucleotide-binding universal stress UspA family protein